MLRTFAILCLLIMGTIAASCTQRSPTREEASTYALSEAPDFTTEIVALPLTDNTTMRFGIKDCHVFRAYHDKENWEFLFKPEAYPLPQACVRERLEFDGQYIQIEIGTQALGAGGCCTSYAAYRSQDGQKWEIRPASSISQWQPLDD